MQALTGADLELILRWQLVLASVLVLAEIRPSPLTLGGVSPEKVVFRVWRPNSKGKTALYRLFGFEA